LKVVLVIPLIILVVLAALLAAFQTPPARKLIARKITRLTRSPDGGGIVIRSIGGFIPFRIRISDFRIRDGAGDWLVAKDVRIIVSPGDLFHFRLRAEEVSAGRLSWLRLPRARDGDKKKSPSEDAKFTLRSLPSFRVDDLSAENVAVEAAVLGERIGAALNGRDLRNDREEGAAASLSLRRTDGKKGQLELSAASGPEFSPLHLKFRLEEKGGGILGKILDPDAPPPVLIRFRGKGPLDRWKVDLTGSAEGMGSLEGELVYDFIRRLLAGELQGKFEKLPGRDNSGKGRISARFTAASGSQDLSAMLQSRDLVSPLGRAEGLNLTVVAEDLLGVPRGTVDLKAEGAGYPPAVSAGHVSVGAGRVAGRLSFRFADPDPGAQLELRLSACTLFGFPIDPDVPSDFTLRTRLKNNRLELALSSEEESSFELKTRASAGIEATRKPFSFRLDEEAPLRGYVRGRMKLDPLTKHLALSRQTLKGTVNTDLTLAGTSSKPEIEGRVVLSDGEYRNLNTGTVLENLAADLAAAGGSIKLERLAAVTPGGGEIDMAGQLKLFPVGVFPYSLSLRLASARLVNLEELTAVLSGKILLEGGSRRGRLHGTLEVDRAVGRIPEKLPAGIPEIEVIEMNKPGGEPAASPPSSSPLLKKLALDLSLAAPKGIVIKGRGLDSEWKADVKIKGNGAAPLVGGGLFLLDGTFIFMGERLRLTNSSITMDGSSPPVPQLKINAEADESDIAVNLQVVGTLKNPRVTLTSQPPYPTDEILARLLYGRPAAQLTGLQAVQIANGLRILQGKGGFFDVLTGWSSFLGDVQVDLTDLEGSSDQAAVRVRWSINRNIYLENQRSIEGSGNVFLARWDLTRTLQIYTQSGYGLLGDSVWLRWQLDY